MNAAGEQVSIRRAALGGDGNDQDRNELAGLERRIVTALGQRGRLEPGGSRAGDVVGAVLILVLPAPAYGHVQGSGGGVEVELLLFGIVLLALGLFLLSSGSGTRWQAVLVLLAGLALAAGAFTLPRLAPDDRSTDGDVHMHEATKGIGRAAQGRKV